VAFFSAVDFDTVLRKDPSMDCQTPSHTDPIEKGHTLTIYELLEEMTKSNPNPSECLLGEPSGENKIVEIDPSETKEFLQANKANDQKQPYNILVNQYMSPKMQRNMGGKSTTSVVSKVDEDKGFEDEVGQEGDLDEFMNDFNTSRSVTMMKEFTVSRRKREIPSSKREMRYGNSQTTTRVTPKDSYVNI
jgi:hypothetical protein